MSRRGRLGLSQTSSYVNTCFRSINRDFRALSAERTDLAVEIMELGEPVGGGVRSAVRVEYARPMGRWGGMCGEMSGRNLTANALRGWPGGGRRVCHSRLGRAGSCGIVRACPDQASGKGSRAFGACPRPLGWGSPGRTCGAELNRVVRSRSMLDPG